LRTSERCQAAARSSARAGSGGGSPGRQRPWSGASGLFGGEAGPEEDLFAVFGVEEGFPGGGGGVVAAYPDGDFAAAGEADFEEGVEGGAVADELGREGWVGEEGGHVGAQVVFDAAHGDAAGKGAVCVGDEARAGEPRGGMLAGYEDGFGGGDAALVPVGEGGHPVGEGDGGVGVEGGVGEGGGAGGGMGQEVMAGIPGRYLER